MAALRHAARRLCEGSLQRSSPVAAMEQRRVFLHGSSPGRRLISNACSSNQKTIVGPHDELRTEFEEKKQELFDLCLEMRGTGAFKTLSWEDFQNLRLTCNLAAQVKPRPEDPNWWQYRRNGMIYDFTIGYFCLGFMGYNLLGGSDKKEAEAKSEAYILSDSTEPANE